MHRTLLRSCSPYVATLCYLHLRPAGPLAYPIQPVPERKTAFPAADCIYLYSARPPQVIFDFLFSRPAALQSLADAMASATFRALQAEKNRGVKFSPLVTARSIAPQLRWWYFLKSHGLYRFSRILFRFISANSCNLWQFNPFFPVKPGVLNHYIRRILQKGACHDRKPPTIANLPVLRKKYAPHLLWSRRV